MAQRLRAVGLCSSDLSSQATQALAALALAVVSRQAQTKHSPKQALALSQGQQAASEQHLVRHLLGLYPFRHQGLQAFCSCVATVVGGNFGPNAWVSNSAVILCSDNVAMQECLTRSVQAIQAASSVADSEAAKLAAATTELLAQRQAIEQQQAAALQMLDQQEACCSQAASELADASSAWEQRSSECQFTEQVGTIVQMGLTSAALVPLLRS